MTPTCIIEKFKGSKASGLGNADATCTPVRGLPWRVMKRFFLVLILAAVFFQLLRFSMPLYDRGNSYSVYVNTFEAKSPAEKNDPQEAPTNRDDTRDTSKPIKPFEEKKIDDYIDEKKEKPEVKPADIVKKIKDIKTKAVVAADAPIHAVADPNQRPNPNPTKKKVKKITKKPKTAVVKKKKICPLLSPKLVGIVKLEFAPPSLEQQERLHSEVVPGGHYKPTECKSHHKVAIIIPYRDRELHLAALLYHLHPILQRQQIDYTFFVVEQAGTGQFNRGMLKNIGVLEAIRKRRYTCLIFHDVDLLTENDLNPYTCFSQPRHMSVGVNTMKYKLPYKDLFGGVAAIEVVPFLRVNGFSNMYWGWGAEDDDLTWRLQHKGYTIVRFSSILSRYTMMPHAKDSPNPTRYKFLNTVKQRYRKDGINTVRYRLLDLQKRPLYTWLYVELFPS